MTILVGADPEVFVRNKEGRFRSAHGLVPGTKKEPYPVANGAVQVDGMALEFNIDPADTVEKFVHNIGSVLGQMAAMVPDYDIAIVPTANFHWRHMQAQPEEALELGCEPDFNAYDEKENPRPDGKTTMRTAAGHLHFGLVEDADPKSPEHLQMCATLVKHCDFFIGLPSLKWDHDNKRRVMYGKAGAFRPKHYGVEYRTLSNAWLRDERLVAFVFNAAQRTVDFLKSGQRVSEVDLSNTRRYIDRGYIPGHTERRFVRQYGLEFAVWA